MLLSLSLSHTHTHTLASPFDQAQIEVLTREHGLSPRAAWRNFLAHAAAVEVEVVASARDLATATFIQDGGV